MLSILNRYLSITLFSSNSFLIFSLLWRPIYSRLDWGSNKILFIDPRASNYNVFSIESDIFYDYAKVYQSLIGFETIIKKQKLVRTYEYDLKRYFEEIFVMKYGYKRLEFLRCITASLLVSLIPLQDEKNSSLFMRLAKKILHWMITEFKN